MVTPNLWEPYLKYPTLPLCARHYLASERIFVTPAVVLQHLKGFSEVIQRSARPQVTNVAGKRPASAQLHVRRTGQFRGFVVATPVLQPIYKEISNDFAASFCVIATRVRRQQLYV